MSEHKSCLPWTVRAHDDHALYSWEEGVTDSLASSEVSHEPVSADLTAVSLSRDESRDLLLLRERESATIARRLPFEARLIILDPMPAGLRSA